MRIHRLDSEHPLAPPFPFDRRFDGDFSGDGITAHHINGHSPGFTVYLFDDALLVCDLVFTHTEEMQFNPHGDGARTREAGVKLGRLFRAGPSGTCAATTTSPATTIGSRASMSY